MIQPDLYDPLINRGYAELEHHYGFAIDPARVRAPKDKGKVERQMPVVRQQLIAGMSYSNLADLNERALSWCKNGIGRDLHGTTRIAPMVRFEEEQPTLLPLPEKPFETPIWAELKVHSDHHILFDRSYYSLPTELIDKLVLVKKCGSLVEIYYRDELVKTHVCAKQKGVFVTDPNDYPVGTRQFLMLHPTNLKDKAEKIGPSTGLWIGAILEKPTQKALRCAHASLRLADRYGAIRLEKACKYVLEFECIEFKRLAKVLETGLDHDLPEEPKSAPLSPETQANLHDSQSFNAKEVNS